MQTSPHFKAFLLAVAGLTLSVGCAGESTESSASAVGMGPDLVVTGFRGSNAADFQTELFIEVCNTGEGPPAGTALIQVAASTDDQITTTDFSLHTFYTPPLVPGECARESASVAVPATGAYWYGTLVDTANAVTEGDETNNIQAHGRLGVGFGSNLRVESVRTRRFGSDEQLLARACNRGNATSGFANLALYMSADDEIVPPTPPSAQDIEIYQEAIPNLEPDQCYEISTAWFGPTQPLGVAAYHLGAFVDPFATEMELIEDDNGLAGRLRAFDETQPELELADLNVRSVSTGELEVSLRACNRGYFAGSINTDIEIFAANTAQAPVNTRTPIGILSADLPGERCVEIVQRYPAPGGVTPLFVGATVDPFLVVLEAIETNNEQTTGPVLLNLPDLTIRTIKLEDVFEFSIGAVELLVCNEGAVYATPTEVRLYQSLDDLIVGDLLGAGSADTFVQSAYTDGIEAGDCQTLRLEQLFTNSQAGYLGAVIDETQVLNESREDNNDASAASAFGDQISSSSDSSSARSAEPPTPSSKFVSAERLPLRARSSRSSRAMMRSSISSSPRPIFRSRLSHFLTSSRAGATWATRH